MKKSRNGYIEKSNGGWKVIYRMSGGIWVYRRWFSKKVEAKSYLWA